MTGRPCISFKIILTSSFCSGLSFSRNDLLSSSLEAIIIATTSGSLSSALNILSVLARPIPSAPILRARAAASGVSAFADPQLLGLVGTRQQLEDLILQLWLEERDGARVDVPGRTVDGDCLALRNRGPVDSEEPALWVDAQGRAADDAGFPDPSRHHGCVGRLSPPAGKYPLCDEEPVYVLGLGLLSYEDHLLSVLGPCDSGIGIEDHLT